MPWNSADKGATISLSNGDKTATHTGTAGDDGVRGTVSRTTGKWYFETANVFGASADNSVGIARATPTFAQIAANAANACVTFRSGSIFLNTANTGALSGADMTGSHTIDVAVDLDNKRIWFRGNGSNWNNNVANNPATNTGGIDITSITGAALFPVTTLFELSTPASSTFNGTGSFARSQPSGFNAWEVDPVSVFLTPGTTTWNVPGDWQSNGAIIEAVGPGGNGANAVVTPLGGGAGQGGGYGRVANPPNILVGNVLTVQIGAGGTTNPTFLRDNTNTIIVQGDYGAAGLGTAGGNRAQTNIGASLTRTGGFGGGSGVGGATKIGGAGGGGAGGPNGNGANGGAQTGANAAGGGGGAASGGSIGADTTGLSGGNGGNNSGGTGGGTNPGSTSPGGAGTPASPFGGAGGAGGGGGGIGNVPGGAGADGREWDSAHGTGGGGGGGGGRGNTNAGSAGGLGGKYGGGGAGGGGSTATPGAGSAGADGLLVITYTPVSSGTVQARVMVVA